MPIQRHPPSELRKQFGERLRLARKLQSLSIDEVARKADVDWSYLSQLERGKRNVGLDLVSALANAVGVAPHLLLNPDIEVSEAIQRGKGED